MRSCVKKRTKHRRDAGATSVVPAFSLIELLVVVAIIGLLAAILMPALSRAREQTRQVACRNNVRSIWTGILAYTLEFNDRVPFMEDVNLTDPNADPFDRDYPTTVGNVLEKHVNEGSWRCPSPAGGYPRDAGQAGWEMTYSFSAAGPIGEGVPYDEATTGGNSVLDPAISNYVHFDGRPLRLLDGRRYVPGWGFNKGRGAKRVWWWSVRRAIVAEVLGGEPDKGKPLYPHKGLVAVRTDLENARKQFEQNTGGTGYKPGYHELHVDGDIERADIFFTRYWGTHKKGY